jgi:hypothetical protein
LIRTDQSEQEDAMSEENEYTSPSEEQSVHPREPEPADESATGPQEPLAAGKGKDSEDVDGAAQAKNAEESGGYGY